VRNEEHAVPRLLLAAGGVMLAAIDTSYDTKGVWPALCLAASISKNAFSI